MCVFAQREDACAIFLNAECSRAIYAFDSPLREYKERASSKRARSSAEEVLRKIGFRLLRGREQRLARILIIRLSSQTD